MSNVDLVRRYFDEIANGGNLDAADEIFVSTYKHTDPGSPNGGGTGSQAIKDEVNAFRGAFPDLVYDLQETITDGDLILGRWVATGTNTGEFMGMPPTGNTVEFAGMTTFRIADGKLAEGWVNRDDLGLLQQLGVVPAPA